MQTTLKFVLLFASPLMLMAGSVSKPGSGTKPNAARLFRKPMRRMEAAVPAARGCGLVLCDSRQWALSHWSTRRNGCRCYSTGIAFLTPKNGTIVFAPGASSTIRIAARRAVRTAQKRNWKRHTEWIIVRGMTSFCSMWEERDTAILRAMPVPFHESPVDAKDPHKGQRQSACDLAFGTSSGAMGIRKFPNPRFNLEKWKQINGGLDTWKGFKTEVKPDIFHSRLRDGSIEPPFYFGMSCGACHIAFDPTNPPKDPANPKHENIKGAIGNQYSMVTAIMSSGEVSSSPLFRIFNYIRSGTVELPHFRTISSAMREHRTQLSIR